MSHAELREPPLALQAELSPGSEYADLVAALPRVGQKLLERCRERMMQAASDQPHKPDDLTFVLYRPVAARTKKVS